MINLLFALLLIAGILWAAKKFYFPTEIAEHPERYPVQSDTKVSRKEIAIVLALLQRWRKEGKLSREEYDHLTDVGLSEMRQLPGSDNPDLKK
ncbi:MAG: hypothetical protein HYY07_05085 [Elusimicrobia bacterium]|nr:hypothetical protein [Elusimicrobiota bacterium]MBI4217925.1 hypothetical protein [Elusimicrobiota bacterium]